VLFKFCQQNITGQIKRFYTRMFKNFRILHSFFVSFAELVFSLSPSGFFLYEVSSMLLVCASLSVFVFFYDVLYGKGRIFKLFAVFKNVKNITFRKDN